MTLSIGIIFVSLGYYIGLNENESLKWLIFVLYLVAASCFITKAILMIKNK